MKSVSVVKIGSLKEANEEKRGKVKVIDVPEQPLGDEDVRIKVAYCATAALTLILEGIFDGNRRWAWTRTFGHYH
jgi:(R,R)-butanediol dehydrogenase/meso-butanediol dehydrogenase/diacetyl reductase/L-iditol 2-dehydrogenase